MPAPKVSDADFVTLFEEIGPHKLSRHLTTPVSGVFRRRTNLERKIGRAIVAPGDNPKIERIVPPTHPGRIEIDVPDGVVLVGSDGHYWPGPPSTAHRAFVKFCKTLKPRLTIMNGDVIDGATISRHPPIGWDKQPTLQEEIEVAQERLKEIRCALPRGTRTLWLLGNHDARLETRIASVLPELAKVYGCHLKDHFGEEWEPAWSAWINDDVVVKHRNRNGIHATHTGTLNAGKTLVTGHLHSLRVTPFTDYNPNTRFGVDCGTLADPWGPQFRYLEDNPRSWRAGFVVLSFRGSRLLWPEVVHVWDQESVEFRGEIIHV